MRVIIEPDYENMSRWAAEYVAAKINAANPTPQKPFKLGCPTGSSPLGLYKHLIEMHKAGKVSFQNVITFNMDEYVGLPEDHPESYHSFMWTNFFSHIDIKKENVHILNGNAPDLIAECEQYEAAIQAAGGIDLFMGGIGPDGHIAFQFPEKPHTHKEPDHRHHHCQQPLLRRRCQQSAQDCPDRRCRHRDGRQRSAHRCQWSQQGACAATCHRRLRQPGMDHQCPADAPTRHHRLRRSRHRRTEARHLQILQRHRKKQSVNHPINL